MPTAPVVELVHTTRRYGKVQAQNGLDLAPQTIDGLQQGDIAASLDQQLYLQVFLPVLQCVLSGAYGIAGLTVNTGAGNVTPDTIGDLIPLIKAGIR